MRVNLFINFYQDKDLNRQKELLICVLSNILNSQIDSVHVLVANKDIDEFMIFADKVPKQFQYKITIHPFEKRPTYNDYFKFTESYTEDINIIANKDMIMDTVSVEKLKNFNWKNYCIALSRWDFINHNINSDEAVLFNRADSQDTWILKGSFPQLNNVDFGLGIAGCDNAIAERLSHYFEVINPSIDIKTYHYHISQVRNYLNANNLPKYTVSKPYKLVPPIKLP